MFCHFSTRKWWPGLHILRDGRMILTFIYSVLYIQDSIQKDFCLKPAVVSAVTLVLWILLVVKLPHLSYSMLFIMMDPLISSHCSAWMEHFSAWTENDRAGKYFRLHRGRLIIVSGNNNRMFSIPSLLPLFPGTPAFYFIGFSCRFWSNGYPVFLGEYWLKVIVKNFRIAHMCSDPDLMILLKSRLYRVNNGCHNSFSDNRILCPYSFMAMTRIQYPSMEAMLIS